MRGLSETITMVTGAGSGIGAAIARRFCEEGSAVAVVDIDLAAAELVCAEIVATGARAVAFSADVTEQVAMKALPARIEDTFGGPLTTVVCNAGVQQIVPLLEIDAQAWNAVVNPNAFGCLVTLQMAARTLSEHGRGSIVTMASIQGRLGNLYYGPYAASKAAVLNLTRSFATELAPAGIRVNAVAPGMIDTPMWELMDRELAELTGVPVGQPHVERVSRVPLGRAGRPEDVAAAVAFLASEDASYITGECLYVCGGDLML